MCLSGWVGGCGFMFVWLVSFFNMFLVFFGVWGFIVGLILMVIGEGFFVFYFVCYY